MSSARATVTCAAKGCHTHVERGMLMCKGHWFSLPKALRNDVWRTWRAAHRAEWGGKTAPDARLKIIAAYREAVRAAVTYLEGVPPTPAAAMATNAIDGDGTPVRYEQGRML